MPEEPRGRKAATEDEWEEVTPEDPDWPEASAEGQDTTAGGASDGRTTARDPQEMAWDAPADGPEHPPEEWQQAPEPEEAWQQAPEPEEAWQQAPEPEEAWQQAPEPEEAWQQAPEETWQQPWEQEAGAPSWGAAGSADEKDFLVFIEEDDDGVEEERLVLAGRRRNRTLGEVDVRPEIEVELLNAGTPAATGGLAISIFGAMLGVAALATFITTYPDQWFLDGRLLADRPVIWFNALFAVLATMALVLGALMTYYGQRLQAHGRMRRLHVIEKGSGETS